MTNTQTSRRLDRLEDLLRVGPDAPEDERLAAIVRAMSPEDHATYREILAKYEPAFQANPALNFDDMDPDDSRTFHVIVLRSYRRLKWPVREDYADRIQGSGS
jgi:hypothetical protein